MEQVEEEGLGHEFSTKELTTVSQCISKVNKDREEQNKSIKEKSIEE